MESVTKTELLSVLTQLRDEDPDFRVFGAQGHHYYLESPLPEHMLQAFERQYHITLPDEYRRFIRDVANGGAGPHYGLWPVETTVEFCNPRRPFPFVELRPHSDSAVNGWIRKKRPGVLTIGHQGCVHYTYLVVNGPHYGTVWNGTHELQPTGLSFGPWYRQWMNRLVECALPILRAEHPLQQVQVGMTHQEVVDMCGGTWKLSDYEGRTFLSAAHVRTRFELDHEGRIMRIIPLTVCMP